jgi:hypothetical protein
MNKRVYNKTFGKIVRTLGFLLILASSGYLATNLILEYQTLPFIDNLLPFATIADGYLDSVPQVAEYAGLALVIGFILILWAIRKGIILRVLLTVVLLVGFIESSINGTSPLVPIALGAPSWLAGVLAMIEPYVDQLTALSPYVVPGIAVAAPFLLWVLFAYKKPGRFSLLLLRLGSIVLFLAVAMLAVQTLFVTSLADVEIYGTINTALYILTYASFLVGSVFGVLGFARK